MSQETKRIKELFGYARTLTKEQGLGVMAARAAGFFKRRFFGKRARYLPAKKDAGSPAGRGGAERRKLAHHQHPDAAVQYAAPAFCSSFWTVCRPRRPPTGSWCWWTPATVPTPNRAAWRRSGPRRTAASSTARSGTAAYAANTNAAAALAGGDYLALADHDDMLAPHAVFCMSKAWPKPGRTLPTATKPCLKRPPGAPGWGISSRTMRRNNLMAVKLHLPPGGVPPQPV